MAGWIRETALPFTEIQKIPKAEDSRTKVGDPPEASGKPCQVSGKRCQASGKPCRASGKPCRAAGEACFYGVLVDLSPKTHSGRCQREAKRISHPRFLKSLAACCPSAPWRLLLAVAEDFALQIGPGIQLRKAITIKTIRPTNINAMHPQE